MGTFNCYIRIWLPLLSDLRPDVEDVGHFDLQIETGNKHSFTVRAKENDGDNEALQPYTFTNPIISYGGGKVVIGNTSDFVLPKNCLLCKCHFTTDEAGIAALVNLLEGWLEHMPKDSDDTSSVETFKVVSGQYINYSYSRNNCFGATAEWCEELGDHTLMNIYTAYTNDTTGYKNYIPWAMFKKYYRAWTFNDLAV